MARNDIRFAQAQQADFSDANAMFQVATNQMNKAVESGKHLVDSYNKEVTARNDALIKGFINSIPKEEWQHSQQDIQEFISSVAEKSGNMYSAGAIEEYRDGRMDTLITRDNAQMKNFIAGEEFNDFKDTQLAEELVAHSRTPDGARQVNALLERLPDTVAHRYDELKIKYDTDKLKSLTGKNVAEAEYNDSTVAGQSGVITNLANNFTSAIENAKYTTDPDKKQAYVSQASEARKAIDGFIASNPQAKNAVMKAINGATPNATKTAQTDSTTAFNQSMARFKADLDEKKLDLAVQEAKDRSAYQAGNLALQTERLAHDIANGGNNGGSGLSKATTELDKVTKKAGYPTKNELTQDSPFKIRNAFQNNVQSAMRAKESELNNVTYSDYLAKESKDFPKHITEKESFSRYSRLEHLQNAFNEYEKVTGGKQLTNYEKIGLTKLLARGDKRNSINEWGTYKDNPIDFIKRNLKAIKVQYQNEVVLAGRAKAGEEMQIIRNAYELTENQALDIILSDGGIGDVADVLPENSLKSYTAFANARTQQRGSEKGNTKKKVGEGTVLKPKNNSVSSYFNIPMSQGASKPITKSDNVYEKPILFEMQ